MQATFFKIFSGQQSIKTLLRIKKSKVNQILKYATYHISTSIILPKSILKALKYPVVKIKEPSIFTLGIYTCVICMCVCIGIYYITSHRHRSLQAHFKQSKGSHKVYRIFILKLIHLIRLLLISLSRACLLLFQRSL